MILNHIVKQECEGWSSGSTWWQERVRNIRSLLSALLILPLLVHKAAVRGTYLVMLIMLHHTRFTNTQIAVVHTVTLLHSPAGSTELQCTFANSPTLHFVHPRITFCPFAIPLQRPEMPCPSRQMFYGRIFCTNMHSIQWTPPLRHVASLICTSGTVPQTIQYPFQRNSSPEMCFYRTQVYLGSDQWVWMYVFQCRLKTHFKLEVMIHCQGVSKF